MIRFVVLLNIIVSNEREGNYLPDGGQERIGKFKLLGISIATTRTPNEQLLSIGIPQICPKIIPFCLFPPLASRIERLQWVNLAISSHNLPASALDVRPPVGLWYV